LKKGQNTPDAKPANSLLPVRIPLFVHNSVNASTFVVKIYQACYRITSRKRKHFLFLDTSCFTIYLFDDRCIADIFYQKSCSTRVDSGDRKNFSRFFKKTGIFIVFRLRIRRFVSSPSFNEKPRSKIAETQEG